MNVPRIIVKFARPAVASALTLAALLTAATGGGCTAATAPATPAPDYSATVEALLPTAPPRPNAIAPRNPVTAEPRPESTDRPAPTAQPPIIVATDRPTAIQFQAITLDGDTFDLSQSRGTPTLIAFWAPW